MARALVSLRDHTFNGEDLHLSIAVEFYGNGVPAPGHDSSVVEVDIPASTASKGAARTLVKNAIVARATQLGYPFQGQAITLVQELLVGL